MDGDPAQSAHDGARLFARPRPAKVAPVAAPEPVIPPAALEPCWFCRGRPAEPRAEPRYELHRDVRRGYTTQGGRIGGRVRYRQLLVVVPRCAACRSAHIWAHRWAMASFWLGLLIGVVIGLVVIVASKSPGLMLLGLAALPASMWAGAWLGRRTYERYAARRGAGRWRNGDGYPPVAAQIAQGWRPGKPFLVTK